MNTRSAALIKNNGCYSKKHLFVLNNYRPVMLLSDNAGFSIIMNLIFCVTKSSTGQKLIQLRRHDHEKSTRQVKFVII